MQVLEQVSFRLANTDAAAFIAANDAVNAWLQSQPGFLRRTLTEAEDGQWADMIVWSGEAEAKAAAVQMNQVMGQFPAMMMIDPASIVMRHSAIRLVA